MKKIFIIITAIFIANLSFASAGKTTQIKVKPEEAFIIVLKSNPSTGYDWYTSPSYLENIINEKSSDFKPDNKKQLCGAGGKRIFTFMALKPGTTDLVLEYKRPWEKNKAPEKTLYFKVVVTPKA